MSSNKIILKFTAILVLTWLVASCSDNEPVADKLVTASVNATAVHLEVHKSPSCGCCEKWLNHINGHGLTSTVYNQDNLSLIKAEKGIAPRYRSCHTAISQQGYVFEGHVPAKFIEQFLQEKPPNDIIGLSVPAMPVGSPGMEVDEKFQPYRILLLKSDGSYQVYASIQSYEEQF